MRLALITPSYAPDLERCRLLVESVERCLPGTVRQYIVVDRRDLALFSPLRSARIELRLVEDLLPWWILRIPTVRRWWLSLQTRPIRSWILQQLVKLSISDHVDADVLVFCDSDVTFLRPFDGSCFFDGDRVALLRVGYQSDLVDRWIATSRQILGVEAVVPPATYVSNLITWRCDTVRRMRDHIEAVGGRHWIRAVCRHWHFSEYMLYGVYAEHVLGLQRSGHFVFDLPLIKPSWGEALRTRGDLRRFFEELTDANLGVMIHSKDGVPTEYYRPLVEAYWRRSGV
jgi:hypothetical protein